MKTRFRVLKCSQFLTETALDNAALKKQVKALCDIDTRRMSRLTLLALAAAAPMRDLPQENVYLGSSFSSPQTFDRLLHTLRSNDVPKPFDFISNINNAAVFQTAVLVHAVGNTLFCAVHRDDVHSWAQPLLCALSDLTLGRCKYALVGWAHEYQPQRDCTKQEGCHWLLLSADEENKEGMYCRVDEQIQSACDLSDSASTYYWQEVIELFSKFERSETVRLESSLRQQIVFEAIHVVEGSTL